MSCKSAIYTNNTGPIDVAVGGVIPLGTVNRRFGCNLNLSGNGITSTGDGYYEVAASFTFTATAAGDITVTMLRDGVAVPGATATETAAAAAAKVNVSFPAIVRQQCCNSSSTLTFVLTGTAATLDNNPIVVKKL